MAKRLLLTDWISERVRGSDGSNELLVVLVAIAHETNHRLRAATDTGACPRVVPAQRRKPSRSAKLRRSCKDYTEDVRKTGRIEGRDVDYLRL